MISQMADFQGAAAASAQTDSANHSDTMGAITTQMTSENGVNVNDQMAQLVQLQAAYSANAHVVSVVQDLFNTLEQAMGS
jgi:flagellar hook-associated protein 1 FlgK